MSLSKDDITRIATELKSMMELPVQTASKKSDRRLVNIVESRGKPKSTKIQICFEYSREGACSYEDKCRYQHVCQRHFDLNGSLEEHPEADRTE